MTDKRKVVLGAKLGTTLPPAKDPRKDSPAPSSAAIPPQTDVTRIEQAPMSRRESWSSALRPSRWVINLSLLLMAGGAGTGGVMFANNQTPPTPQKVTTEAVGRNEFEAEKAERIRTTDILRQAVRRQEGFESEVGAALAEGPKCMLSKLGRQTVVTCGGYKLDGVPSRGANVISESMDPPTYRVELDGQDMPRRPTVP